MWLDGFPLPAEDIPERLRRLVEGIPANPPDAMIEVAVHLQKDLYGPDREDVLMQTSLVPEVEGVDYQILRSGDFNVVSSSTPIADRKADLAEFAPSIQGRDYIVASWGDNSFYNFYLAEKVWMALGLSARAFGGTHQRLIFDDLRGPVLGVAEGEASNEYEWTSKRPVVWRMRSDYLHRYLWMRGARGVRHFYYSKVLPSTPGVLRLLDDTGWCKLTAEDGRYEGDIRPHKEGHLLQLWGAAVVLEPVLSHEPSAEGLIWPGDGQPMTSARANALVVSQPVFVKDTFLDRYEQDAAFECHPVEFDGRWHTSPGYRNQWSFTDCVRVGRDAIRIPMRELYKPKPAREIVNAFEHVLGSAEAAAIDATQPHILIRVNRIVQALLQIASGLAQLGNRLGVAIDADSLFGLSADEIAANQWRSYPELRRLARVAPRDMSQSAFLTRCKALNELVQRMPVKPLKRLLILAECREPELAGLRSLRLLQAMMTLAQELNARGDDWTGFVGLAANVDWLARNATLRAIFQLNDLRNAEAHENFEEVRQSLEEMGFDTALLNGGYGSALDYVFDSCAEALEALARAMAELLDT
jgi:hypothetical protein